MQTAQVSLQCLQATANEVVNHILEKSHRDISLRKIFAVTEGTGGEIYTIGNHLSESAWAKTHPTDTTTDSLSLAIKRHSSSWVSERDLVGFGFRLGCIFSPEKKCCLLEKSKNCKKEMLSTFPCCFLQSSSVLLYLPIFLFQYFFPLHHCSVRKIIGSMADAFFWQQELWDWTCGYIQSLQLLQIKKQPTLVFMKYVFL